MNVKLLENTMPFWVTEMSRDRKTASGKISKTERGQMEGKRASLSAFLAEVGGIFSFIMSWTICARTLN